MQTALPALPATVISSFFATIGAVAAFKSWRAERHGGEEIRDED